MQDYDFIHCVVTSLLTNWKTQPPPPHTHTHTPVDRYMLTEPNSKLRSVLRGYCTPNQLLACFVVYLKIINTLLKNNRCILKQIVHETQKWHWNFNKPRGFLVMDQNSQSNVLIDNSRMAWPT